MIASVDARKDVLTRLHATGVLERKMNLVIDELVGSGSVDKNDIFKRVENIKLMDEVSIKEAQKIAKAKAASRKRHKKQGKVEPGQNPKNIVIASGWKIFL